MALSRLHFVLFVCFLGAFTTGLALGFSSATTLQIYFNTIWAAIFSSCLNIGALISCISSQWLIHHYGYHRILLFSYHLSILGWITLYLSSSTVYERYAPTIPFISGRLLTGLGCGLTLVTNSIYAYEIIPCSLKVSVVSLLQIGVTCGIVVVYALAVYLNWDVISLICALFVLFTMISTCMLRESPKYCIANGNLQSSETSHSSLYENELPFKQEENGTVNSLNDPQNSSDCYTKSWTSPLSYVMNNQRSRLRMAFLLVTFQQLTGITVIIYFAESVCLFGGLLSYMCAFYTGLYLFVSSIISVLVIKRVCWRKLLQIGALIMALSHFSFSLTLLYTDGSMFVLNQVYLAICAITFSCSWGPLPFLIILELFPNINRNYAVTSSLAVSWIIGFFVTISFEPFISWISVSVLFFIYSSFCLLACLYVHRYVPDMKSINLI
ncbi:unnamed protein product [Heterobilharzia americana]|nr:unnamed protein product [Heterobilharzia americana]CAH8572952.1 unnamed protein product [Heterobilharzia americana]